MFKILKTEVFEKDFNKLSSDNQKRVSKELKQLYKNPYVGKPLGYDFFREKKIGKFRVYYLIYDEYLIVYVIALSDKKSQNKTIKEIKNQIVNYKKIIEKINSKA